MLKCSQLLFIMVLEILNGGIERTMDTETESRNHRYLSRDATKYVAMAAMLLNHIASIFLTPGSWLFEGFLAIGYFTAITMVYFLVEATSIPTTGKPIFSGCWPLRCFLRSPIVWRLPQRGSSSFAD